MKKTLLLTMLFCLGYLLNAQVSKTVAVTTAGTLTTLLTATEKTTITNLTISGNIDARDVKCMRDEMTVLAVLDMSGASIVAYTGSAGTDINTTEYQINTLPPKSFFNYETKEQKKSLKNVTLPNSVTLIGNFAFTLTGLTTITLPNALLTIDEEAFTHCSGLTSIALPNSLKTIGYNAFGGCTGLTSIAVPNTVTSIGKLAFNTTGVTSISWPNTLPTINNAYEGCVNITTLNLPNTVTTLGEKAFSRCTGLANVNLPNTITTIGADAFSDCTGLTSVILPNTITTIGDYAFRNCTGLQSCRGEGSLNPPMPNSITNIGIGAFRNCTSLTRIDLPSNLAKIEEYTFYGCTKLQNVLYKLNSLTIIGRYAFYDCQFFELTFPNSLTSIGDYAFNKCNNLLKIGLSNSLVSIGKYAFAECTSLSSITVPCATPPNADYTTFNSNGSYFYDNCKLIIPTGTTSIYKSFNPWYQFKSITEAALVTTPVSNISNTPVTIYTTSQAIVVTGAPQGQTVAIYNTNGALLQSVVSQGDKLTIPVNAGAVYLVKVGSETFKVGL